MKHIKYFLIGMLAMIVMTIVVGIFCGIIYLLKYEEVQLTVFSILVIILIYHLGVSISKDRNKFIETLTEDEKD